MNELEITILDKVLYAVAVFFSGGLVFLFRRIFQHTSTLSEHETLLALCAQRDKQWERLRKEERELRDNQRKEILGKIDSHHNLVMKKLEALGKLNG